MSWVDFMANLFCGWIFLIQSLHPIPKTQKEDVLSTIEELKDKLLALNPAQFDLQLAAINRLLEGTGTVIDIKLPTEAQKTRGRPKGAPNKPKTTCRDPSSFEHVENKRKNEEKSVKKFKKQKLDETKSAEKKEKADKKINKEEEKKPKRGRPPTRKSVPVPEKPAPKRALPACQKLPPPLKKPQEKPEDVTDDEEQPAPRKKFRPIKKHIELPPSPSPPPSDAPLPEPTADKEPPEDPSLIPSLPLIIQSSVKKALNVRADGHCGFRVVAWALGRGQGNYQGIREEMIDVIKNCRQWYLEHGFFHNIDSVLERLTAPSGRVGISKWMSMPSMGDVMANAFETPVFFFSPSWSQTFFPYFSPPNNNPPIFLALVDDHFVPLVLQDTALFPAPQLLHKDWGLRATPDALPWGQRYSVCFEKTVEKKLSTPAPRY